MQQGFTGVMRRFAVAGSNWGAVTSQRRSAANPYMEAHQESELSCFPPRAQPRVLYTGKAKYDVAYMLQREPIVTPEVHPMIADFEEAVEEVHKAYPRTQDGSNISRVLKKNLPDAYRTLTNNQQTPYWREPKFVQQELTALRTLKISQRVTPLDVEDTSSRTSLQRRLQERLFLIIEKDGVWQFPSLPRKQGESLRSAVDRGIADDHRGALETHMLSNAPTGHAKTADDRVTLFFPVFYLTGMPRFPLQESQKHAWVTRNELREYTFPSLEYKKAVYAACHDPWMPYDVPIFSN